MLESVLSIPEGMLSLEDKGRNFNIKLSKSINFPHIPILICTPTTMFYSQVENTCTTPSFHWEVRFRDHKASLTQPFFIQLPKSERSWIFFSRGGSRRGRTQRAPPPKIGKILDPPLVRCIYLVSFYNFSIRFWNCFDSLVFNFDLITFMVWASHCHPWFNYLHGLS
jgi:hypothetical protein